MIRISFCILLLLLTASASYGGTPGKDGEKLLSGMSIVGNDAAPKSLVIVPVTRPCPAPLKEVLCV